MWATKLSFDGTKINVLARYAKREDVRVLIFPLSWSYEGNRVIVNITGVLYGDSKSKKRFIKNWKKDKTSRLMEVELNEDFFVGIVMEYSDAKTLYNKNIIFTQPILIKENGHQEVILHSFDKKYLEKVIKTFEKFHEIKIHYIRKEKVSNISFKANAPKLTNKQKEAMELAVRKGYYEYPRKSSVKGLAKLSKLGFATFHAHLRKAEQKLMPFFFTR